MAMLGQHVLPGNDRSRDQELATLKRVSAQVRTEHDFLKEAAAYLAKLSKRSTPASNTAMTTIQCARCAGAWASRPVATAVQSGSCCRPMRSDPSGGVLPCLAVSCNSDPKSPLPGSRQTREPVLA